jgi:hypothetical protein
MFIGLKKALLGEVVCRVRVVHHSQQHAIDASLFVVDDSLEVV